MNVYLDHAAATPIDPKVIGAMSASAKQFGNPSSFNNAGRQARALVEQSRKAVADFLHARADEIVFTSSGSEANNLVLKGFLSGKKGRVITTPIEHPSVLECLKSLSGIKIDFLPVSTEGFINPKDLQNKLGPDVLMVSIMYANNEIGTIQPIKQCAKIIHQYNKDIKFHVDACQATEYLDMDVQRLGVDLLTINGSKIYGPRGIGALYVKRGALLKPLISGGSQERGLRAGTENTLAIAGLAKALSLFNKKESKRLAILQDYFFKQIETKIPAAKVNGSKFDRLPNNINISVPELSSEILLLELDKKSISAGSGSACTFHAVEPSHVLKAISVPARYINGALRFSMGHSTTKKEIDYTIKSLVSVIKQLRQRYGLSK